MTRTTTVPLTVTPEAAAHVAQLGLHEEFEQMLEHTRQAVPGLRSIQVKLEYNPETEDQPAVVIWSSMEDRGLDYDPTAEQWSRWEIETFPPEVCIHFVMVPILGATDDAG